MRDLSKYMNVTPVEFLEVVSLEAFDGYLDTVQTLAEVMAPVDADAVVILEHLSELRASNEGFVETVKSIVEMVLRWLSKLKDWWKLYFNEVTLGLVQLKMHVEGLMDLSTDAIGKRGKNPQPMEFIDRIPSLSLFYKPITEISGFIAGLLLTMRTVKPYFDWVEKALEPAVARLAAILGGIRIDEIGEEDLDKLLGVLETVNPTQLTSTLSLKAGSEDPNTLYSAHMLGNLRLALRRSGDLTTLKDFNSVSLRLVASAENTRPIPDKIKFARFAGNYSDQCLKQILEIIELLQKYFTPQALGKRENLLKTLESSTQRLGSGLTQEGDLDAGQKRLIEDALTLSKTLSTWMVSPYQELTTNTIRVLRAGCMVCKANALPDKRKAEAK